MSLENKLRDLEEMLAEKDRVLISFSGGIDSSLLAKVTSDLLGKNALCAILDSETLPRSELEHARSVAESIGIDCRIMRHSALNDSKFVANPPNRCYHCKKQSAKLLKRVARENGVDCIADGINISDCGDFRPGIQAAGEEGIWHPFIDAKISKEDIREIAKQLGLPFWSRPSSACLASRIPYGERITRENLQIAEMAEDYLKSLGYDQIRVRVYGRMARVEVPEEDMETAFRQRIKIVDGLKEIGFVHIALDLEGFRSGSMNAELDWGLE